jgi:hypothetical protein
MRNDAQIVVAIFGALSRFAAEADLGTSRAGSDRIISCQNNGENISIFLVIAFFSTRKKLYLGRT